MLISHRHKFLYFVIPKCGSATLRQSLAPHADIGWPVNNYEQHVPIKRFLLTPEAPLLSTYFRFTFTRNPYDRIYSGYLQDRFASEHYPRWTKEKKPIFDEIGEDFAAYLEHYVSTADIGSDWRWICFCPMTEFATLDGKNMLDFVGRAEHLEEDMNKLGDALGLTIQKAPDHNVRTGTCSESLKYIDKYTPRSIQIVNDLYAQDFANFGYTMLDPA
ncbi:sulfotransferase family 2 domain-containing protein [Rhodanobacter sp. Root627]|uniref:sulfotransferase family 2 domain-containing protein n=1 Tax=Rhodanobacter sp. Root627 TaxID=1736572 RepID=UPI0009EA98EF|nr:sulfotransferase family 2 domain-containing protein [Rhodanobacter sp. Root627]